MIANVIDIQCFKGKKIKTKSAMHDLRAMYEKTLEYAADVIRYNTDDKGNFQFYPIRARLSDLQVMALAIAAVPVLTVRTGCSANCASITEAVFPNTSTEHDSIAGFVNCRYAS